MIKVIKIPVRCVIFAVGFFFYFMEISADWIVGMGAKTEYIRQGSCKRCGRCCRFLALEMPRYLERWKRFVKVLRKVHTFCFNFRDEGQDRRWLLYRCRYLQDGDQVKCSIYHFRHRICRLYPRQRLYGHPKLHPDCGFKFVRRDGKLSFDEVLRKKRSDR